jgi:hypothetical protein
VAQQPSSTLPKELSVYHTLSHRNFTISPAHDKTPILFVANSIFTPGQADVTVHRGADRTGAVVGLAHFERFSSRTAVGLGDPATPAAVAWEALTKQSRDHSAHRWEMALGGARRGFVWKRTHAVGGDAGASRLSMRHMKLVDGDGDGGAVLARYLNNGTKSYRKKGKFRLVGGWGEEWELMVLLTGLALIERERRRNAARTRYGMYWSSWG